MATTAATTTHIRKNKIIPEAAMASEACTTTVRSTTTTDKVGMCYFHHPRNKFYCPTVSTDRFWSFGPDDIKDPATACDDSSALLTGVTPSCYSKILR